jgi:hypothetical protein
MKKHLFVGGLVAAGFDPTGKFLLTVSHAGRGLFAIGTWERVARDPQLAYPEGGVAVGIGPIEGVRVPVTEMDYPANTLRFSSPDGSYHFAYESGTITATGAGA